MRRQSGFTLIELAISMTILALLLAAALPAFASYLTNAKLREAANTVMATAMWSRNEAIKANARTNLRIAGKSVEVSLVDNGALVLLRRVTLPNSVQTADFIAGYDSAGRLTPFGTELTLAFTPVGQGCSMDIRCPVIRFDAGGSTSLCTSGACQ
jgi:type IV fimbrial biogenesis protein FimT